MMCGTGVMVHCSQGGAVQNWRFVALQRYNPSDCVKIAVSLSPLEGLCEVEVARAGHGWLLAGDMDRGPRQQEEVSGGQVTTPH